MRVLGIDPGLATIGLGVIEAPDPNHLQPIEWLTITTKAGLPLSDRLLEIQKDLGAFLDETKPDLVVVEKLFFGKNETNALDVAQARGVILVEVAKRGFPILEPTPMQMKLGITGDGGAKKDQVQMMLVMMLKLTEIPRPDDAADALALAAYGALHQNTLALTGT